MKIIKSVMLVLFVCALAGPAGANTFQLGNSEYWIVYDHKVSWEDASYAAEQAGGHLATITSTEENDFLRSTVLAEARGELWLGGVQTSDPGLSAPKDNWTWVTGEEWNFTDWHKNEANNAGNRDEKYLGTWDRNEWSWNDEGNISNINGYVVEKNLNTAPTPIPAGIWIMGVGLATLAGVRRRFSKS